MSIQYHFLGFPRIGNDEHLAAIAQAKMGNLDELFYSANNRRFMTPVELTSLTGWKG